MGRVAARLPHSWHASHRPRPRPRYSAGQKEYPVPAYPGLVLPYETGAINDGRNAAVNDAVNPFLRKVMGTWIGAVVAQKALKSDLASLDPLKQLVVAEIPGLSDMPPSYNHYGNDDFAAQLCVILETNPFFTASLTPRAGGGFELVSYDPDNKNAPYNLKIMRDMDRTGPQVNFRFSVKPGGGLAIDGYDVFEDGVKIAQPDESKPYGGSDSPLQYFASAALYDLFYVAQTLHGSIHVMHYVLTNALKYASSESEDAALNKWAVEYNSNVNSKYAAVTKVLIALDGEGLLTSPKGLGGTFATLPHLKANIEAWGKCTSADEYLDHWFQSPREDLEAAGLCSEFFKHTSNGAAFSVAASEALETADSSKLATTNEKLKEYIGASGAWAPEENGIKTVRSLVDMMVVTGLIHGGTLSMTRLLNKPQFFRWRNIEEKAWGMIDAKCCAILFSTIMGVQKDKHVAGSIMGGIGKWAITNGPLQKALEISDLESLKLQQAYQAKIVQRDDYNDVGFLLTDYCTEGFDGKQLTLATYI